MKLLLKISYLGTAYCGYQVQPNGISIQQMLNEAAEAVFGCVCDIVGCSRTDSGVHANCFCATVAEKGKKTLETAIPVEKVPLALTAHLPNDICVFDADWVQDSFHARYDVKEKEYLYRIYNRRVRDPFEEGRSCFLPNRLDETALKRMQTAATYLTGTHDFASYMAQGSKITQTVRTVTRLEILREGKYGIIIRIAADGFLYHMVRILVGTLLDVGYRRIEPEDIPRITESRQRKHAGSTMPACGLYLNRVSY